MLTAGVGHGGRRFDALPAGSGRLAAGIALTLLLTACSGPADSPPTEDARASNDVVTPAIDLGVPAAIDPWVSGAQEEWSVDLPPGVFASKVVQVADGKAIFEGDGVHAFSLSNGEHLWSTTASELNLTPDSHWPPMAVVDGRHFIMSTPSGTSSIDLAGNGSITGETPLAVVADAEHVVTVDEVRRQVQILDPTSLEPTEEFGIQPVGSGVSISLIGDYLEVTYVEVDDPEEESSEGHDIRVDYFYLPTKELVAVEEGPVRVHVAWDGTLLLSGRGPSAREPGGCTAYRDGQEAWTIEPPTEQYWCVGAGGYFYSMEHPGSLTRTNLQRLDPVDGSPMWEQPYAGEFSFPFYSEMGKFPGVNAMTGPHSGPETGVIVLDVAPGRLAVLEADDGAFRHFTDYDKEYSNAIINRVAQGPRGMLLVDLTSKSRYYFSYTEPGLAWSVEEEPSSVHREAYIDDELLLLSEDSTLTKYRPSDM